MKKILLAIFFGLAILKGASMSEYKMPDESELHEATWLAWPHEHQYGKTYAKRLETT